MQQLAAWLRSEVERTSIRSVAERTRLGTGTISRIASGAQTTTPDLETLVQLTELGKPLSVLMEYAGFNLGLPAEDDSLLVLLRAESQTDPLMAEILDLLAMAPNDHRRAVLAYLRGARGDTDRPGQRDSES